jgi:hypothetical protein
MKPEASPSQVTLVATSPVDLLTKEQFAVACHVTSRTVEKWMKRGFINYVKFGRAVRFEPSEVARCRQNCSLNLSLPTINPLQQPGLVIVNSQVAQKKPAAPETSQKSQRAALKAGKVSKS